MEFTSWLNAWLNKHPLRTPEVDSQHYTSEVMAQVRAHAQPKPRFIFPSLAPSFAFAAACAAAILLVLAVRQPGSATTVAQVEDRWQVLLPLVETVVGFLEPGDMETKLKPTAARGF